MKHFLVQRKQQFVSAKVSCPQHYFFFITFPRNFGNHDSIVFKPETAEEPERPNCNVVFRDFFLIAKKRILFLP